MMKPCGNSKLSAINLAVIMLLALGVAVYDGEMAASEAVIEGVRTEASDRCACSINGQCFSLGQVALANATKCYQVVCRASETTVGARMIVENVDACGRCCLHDGRLYAAGQEQQLASSSGNGGSSQDCLRTCRGNDQWSACGGGVTGETGATTTNTAAPTTTPASTDAGV